MNDVRNILPCVPDDVIRVIVRGKVMRGKVTSVHIMSDNLKRRYKSYVLAENIVSGRRIRVYFSEFGKNAFLEGKE
ncbi:MAG: hypothetical protein ACI3XA_06820 [Clostridia bacterium]